MCNTHRWVVRAHGLNGISKFKKNTRKNTNVFVCIVVSFPCILLRWINVFHVIVNRCVIFFSFIFVLWRKYWNNWTCTNNELCNWRISLLLEYDIRCAAHRCILMIELNLLIVICIQITVNLSGTSRFFLSFVIQLFCFNLVVWLEYWFQLFDVNYFCSLEK